MSGPKSPGPAAARAFRTGIWTAAVAGVALVGVLFWMGLLGVYLAGFVLVVLFPVYMLVAASLLSKWLGYDKDMRDLRRVTRDEDDGPFSGSGPR